MNAALAVAGRAIGHRIWQSIEYYMANYPDVRAAQKAQDKDALAKALHIAFEDQLVQKVMPKLRGIDTRGKGKTECLDRILAQINTGIGGNPFNLAEDFNLACELGYGQFIWQSADYLRDADPATNVLADVPETEVVNEASESSDTTSQDTQSDQPRNEAVATDLSQPSPNYCVSSPDREKKWSKLGDRQKRIWWDRYRKSTEG